MATPMIWEQRVGWNMEALRSNRESATRGYVVGWRIKRRYGQPTKGENGMQATSGVRRPVTRDDAVRTNAGSKRGSGGLPPMSARDREERYRSRLVYPGVLVLSV